MNLFNDLFTGVIIGLIGSFGLGPIGVLCIQRTLTKKFIGGFSSGLGAAVADTIIATFALYAISFVMPYIKEYKTIVSLIGGVVIIFMGSRIYFSKLTNSNLKRNRQSKMSLIKDFLSVFFLTISNPTYFLVFLTLFASFGVNGDRMNTSQHLSVIFGILIGASCWWFVLTFLVSLLRKKFRAIHIHYFNKIAGIVIAILGIILIVNGFIDNTSI